MIATSTKQTISNARFSLTPRSNVLIEILRLVALCILVVEHWGQAANIDLIHNHSYVITQTFTMWIWIYPFIIITGIFTIGKGKDYFLRNLSRMIFVIVIVSLITIPIFQTIYSDRLTTWGWRWDRLAFGGRDVWYLYALLLASVFLPLIKIEHLIIKHKSLFALIGLILVPFSLFNDMPFIHTYLSPICLFCMALASHIFYKIIFSLDVEKRAIYVFGVFVISSLVYLLISILLEISVVNIIPMLFFVIFLLHFKVPTPPPTQLGGKKVLLYIWNALYSSVIGCSHACSEARLEY